MPFEWDETKHQTNLEKHGVDFEQAEAFHWETALVEPELRYAEARFRAYGYIGDRLHLLVFTMRGTNIRVISLRKANRTEENRYAAS